MSAGWPRDVCRGNGRRRGAGRVELAPECGKKAGSRCMESRAGPGAAPVEWGFCTILVQVVNLTGAETVGTRGGREGDCRDEGTVLVAVAGCRWTAGIHQLRLQLHIAPAQPSPLAQPWATCLGKEACAAAEGSACVCAVCVCVWSRASRALRTRGSEITRSENAYHQELRNWQPVVPVWRLTEVDRDGFCGRGYRGLTPGN